MNLSTKKNIKLLIGVLKKHYAPAEHNSDARLTTEKVFAALQEMLPSEDYTAEDVYKALEQAGFKFSVEDDDGRPQFSWQINQLK